MKIITHRQLRVGDNISLEFPGGGWQMAKVTSVSEGLVTLFRPWMDALDGYPRIGVEVFTVYRDSDKTAVLFDRTEPEE